jgi:phenylacetate-CoA ligase
VDLYRPVLANALFPAFEAARGRPTVPLLRYLRETERWPIDRLLELQSGLLRRLIRHAYRHTAHYRGVLDERGLSPEAVATVGDLAKLPLLERPELRASLDTRTATAPPGVAITKTTSGSSGEPVVVRYNAESRHWRDAVRWRGYGWGGYHVGMRALHYWGAGPAQLVSWWKQQKIAIDRRLKRDRYLDCTPRDDASLSAAVAEVRRFRPHAMVAYASGAGALARFVNERRLRAWDDFPVLTGAERLLPQDRAAIEAAFGPAFDTYGCREVMLVASECEAHDGMHTSMEKLIVELVVREPGGAVRAARPGEVGEVVITDLHNLACPMIRYVNGDLATARPDELCACGRSLRRIGPIEGRVTETLLDGAGRPVGGLVFNILFGIVGHVARTFQVTQRADRSIVFKVVPATGARIPEREERLLHEQAAKYLPGAPFSIEYVADIPLSPAGKRRVVVVERAQS